MEKQSTSGQTVNTQTNYEPPVQRIYVKDIFEEVYHEEMDALEVECMTPSGDLVTLLLPTRHIERFSLYMRMTEAENRFYKYLQKNY